MKSIELFCFGPPTARLGGKTPPPDVLWRKHLALLIYLALSPELRRSRAHLLGLLWPEKPEERARHSLSEAVRHLRAGLGEARLESRGDTVVLSGVKLEVDVVRFESLVQEDPVAALALFKGDFLEGLYLNDAPEFEDWVAGRRAHFGSVAATLFLRRGETALACSRFVDAVDAARRALELRPSWQPAVSLFMRSAALVGDTAAALAAYDEFRGTVGDQVAEAMARELKALAERIRSQSWRLGPSRAETAPPLVGR